MVPTLKGSIGCWIGVSNQKNQALNVMDKQGVPATVLNYRSSNHSRNK